MSRIRKTADVARILKRTNHRLLHSTCSPDVRRGMATVLESILMDSGLYAGFGYYVRKDLDDVGLFSEKPGVLYIADNIDNYPAWGDGLEITAGEYFAELTVAKEAGRKPTASQSFPDESRRFYYPHSAIHWDYRQLGPDGESKNEADEANANTAAYRTRRF